MFTMGAKLDGDDFPTKKEKKSSQNNGVIPKNQHQLVFTFEKRKGKPVTLVGKFYISENDKKGVLKYLKKSLACGGSIKDEWIEIQGNMKTRIIEVLEKDGWKFRKK